MSDFLADNWGNLASVAGLLFSFLAFIFSKRASNAAREARNWALRQSMSEEMNGASKKASEIVTHVALERGDVALLRVGELIDLTSFLLARWDSRLTKNSKDNLLTAREQLRIAHQVLSRGTFSSLPPKDRRSLSEACRRVSAILSEEHGAAVKATEVD